MNAWTFPRLLPSLPARPLSTTTPSKTTLATGSEGRPGWAVRWAALLLGCLIGLPAAGEDLDLKPLGHWPQDAFANGVFGTRIMALVGGKVIANRTHHPIPSLVVVEPAGTNPFEVLGALPFQNISSIAVAGQHALVLEDDRLSFVDLSDASKPTFQGMLWTGAKGRFGGGRPLAVSGTHAYLYVSTFSTDQPEAPPARITVVDFRDPTQPRVVGEVSLPTRPGTHYYYSFGVVADDGLLCVASLSAAEDWSGKFALDVFDITNPAAPRWVGQYETANGADYADNPLALVGRRAYWALHTPAVGLSRYTLEVVDLSEPASPKLLGTFRGSGQATSLGVKEPHVYLAKWGTTSDGNPGISVDIVDMSDPAAPRRVGGFTGSNIDTDPIITVEEAMAVLSSRSGVATYDISNPAVMRQLATSGQELGAFDVTLAGGRAFVRSGDALKILDISRPETPHLLGSYRTVNQRGIRQMVVAGNHAYLATFQLGLQTLDVSDPAAPRRTSTFRGTSEFAAVAVEGPLLAVAGTEGLFLLDLTEPSRPLLRGQANVRYPDRVYMSVAISGHHVLVVSSDRQESKTGVLEVFDASNPAAPQLVGAYEVPAIASAVAASGSIAVVTSWLSPGGTGFADILDISDPAHPILLAQHPMELRDESSATVKLSGNRAVLGGPQLLDMSDPRQPRRIMGLVQTADYGVLAGDVLWAGSYLRGLQSYRISTSTLPRSRTLAVERPVLGVAPQGDLAWLALGEAGLEVVDRRQPDASARLGHLPLDGKAWGVGSAGTHALVAAGEAGLVIVDTADPANPQQLGVLDTPGEARAVAVSGTTACVADASGGVRVVDVSHPASPRELAGFATPGQALAVVWHGSHALVACREAGLQVLHLADPAQPQLVGSYLVRGTAEAVAVSGHHAYLADGVEGFLVLDVSDPARPRRVGLAPGPHHARSIAVSGRFAYVADEVRGIRVFDIGDPTRPREVGGTAAVNAHQLALTGDRLLAAGGMGGLAEFEFFEAPMELGFARSGRALRLSWPVGDPGFRLESSSVLGPLANWLPEPTVPETVGEQKVVTLEIGTGPRYFRLKKP